MQTIPPEWDIGKTAQDALVDLILQRACYIVNNIIEAVWPQGRFNFMNEEEDPS